MTGDNPAPPRFEFIDYMDDTDRIMLLRGRGQEDAVPFYAAVRTARFVGINPGGEVQGFEITEHIEKIPERLRMRLLSKEQLEEAGLI